MKKNSKNIFLPPRYTFPSKGFTLVELMISLTLFTIVVLAAVTTLYSINAASRRVEATRSVLDNLNFAMESMSRTIRTGTDVSCYEDTLDDCKWTNPQPNPGIWLTQTLGVPVPTKIAYQWDPGTGQIQKKTMNNGTWSDWVSLTAPEINIQHMQFYVDGTHPIQDGVQANVILFVQGVATLGENTAPFAIQTLVSVRNTQ